MEKIILSKFSTLIASLRNRVDCELIYAYAVDSNFEVIVILPSDMLSDFAHTVSLINQGSNSGISDIEAHVEVLDACEHSFKVKITYKSK